SKHLPSLGSAVLLDETLDIVGGELPVRRTGLGSFVSGWRAPVRSGARILRRRRIGSAVAGWVGWAGCPGLPDSEHLCLLRHPRREVVRLLCLGQLAHHVALSSAESVLAQFVVEGPLAFQDRLDIHSR